MYKCTHSEEFYAVYQNRYSFFIHYTNKICSTDPHFYQACDKKMSYFKITNNEVLCENYLCLDKSGPIYTPLALYFSNVKCTFDCQNTVLNKEGCNYERVILPTGDSVLPSEVCNDVCDVFSCEDEANCNGYHYGKYCLKNKKLYYLPHGFMCNSRQDCDDGEDEQDCTVSSSTDAFCRHAGSKEIVPIHNYTKCAPIDSVYCIYDEIPYYQTNCTDPLKVAVTCEIDGYLSSVSKYMMCYGGQMSVCDDHIDRSCYSTKNCKVHKHLLCDQNKDCNDNSDETHPICLSTTEGTCKRRVGGKNELKIPISWLRDGIWDCEDGIDETADWPKCGVGKTSRYMSSTESECKNVFICRSGGQNYELLENICDGLENGGNENEICSISSRSQSLITTVSTTNKGLTKTLSFCRKGLAELERFTNVCKIERFIYPNGDIFGGQTTLVILPNSKQSCDYMYSEQYLYTSCTGHCLEASCPLRNIPRYEVCPNQFPDRVGTIVNNEYLIFLTKSFGEIYTNRYFVCTDNKKCIDYSNVCNLVYDCADGSDEAQCTNHFQCNSSGKLLPKSKKCDKHFDCADLSDECNEQCSKKILEGTFLKGLSWFIGLLAILANLVIIGKSLRAINRCKTSVALINRIFIILIALGDFLIGCYLFIIATYDAIVFRQNYCKSQVTWITSSECSVVGVLSTIGSQISLFSMTGLSMVRIYGIWNSMKIPGEVALMKVLKIAAAMSSFFIVSAIVALVPILESFEDFFVNGVRFSDGLKIFIGTPDKATVTKIIQAYHGRTKDTSLRWKMLIEVVREMFSHDLDYEDLTEKVDKVDFYGNDGVCLFKYFVQNQDPQRLFVWSILALNFLCFVLISISYLFIGILSRQSSRSVASSQNNRQISQRNNRMNQKIAIIITTDFLCWVPFIVICVLHSLEVIDATPWYSVFSMVILPINSVINPLLYDDAITETIGSLVRSLTTRIANSTVVQRFRQKVSPAPAEEMTLQDRNTNITHITETTQDKQRETAL